jgi:hypothetical protein
MSLAFCGDWYALVRESRALYGVNDVWRKGEYLLTLGLNPYRPTVLCGILILPPMSVPNPIRDPCSASNAPSPPVDPPGEKFGL